MRLFHVTIASHLESISAHGLLVCCTKPSARLKAVWLCTASKVAWAIVHVATKYKTALEHVVIVEVEVNRKTLKRYRSGLWLSHADVDASAIKAYRPAACYGQGVSC